MVNLETLPEIEALVRSLGVPWSVDVGWSDAASYIGQAQYWRGEDHFHTVRFSRKYWPHLSTEQRRLIVIHEVAHTLRPPGDHHSAAWKALCLSLGGDGKRCTALPEEVTRAVSKWEGTCPRDRTHLVYRKRLTQKVRNHSCGQCSDHWSPSLLFDWKELR